MKSSGQIGSLAHHAYLCIGIPREAIISYIKDQCLITVQGNPDFFDLSLQSFTIDDARRLKSLHSTRPVGASGKKIFVLSMNGITVEAQNALLKLFEEPAEYAHFFVIIPSAHLLLSTVRSRMQEFSADGKWKSKNGKNKRGRDGGDDAFLKSVKRFVTLSKGKRLEEIKRLIDDIAKEKRTKQDAVDFLNAIESAVHAGGVAKNRKTLESLELARTYMNDRAPSLKMLLEYVALNI